MPTLVEYLCNHAYVNPRELALRFRSDRYRRSVEEHLRDQELRTTHLDRNRTIPCDGISIGSAVAVTAYTLGTRRVSVSAYYQERRRRPIRLRHPYLPCVEVRGGGDHTSFFPLELINVERKRTIHLPPRGTALGQRDGHLQLIFGPMYAGKTQSLIYSTDLHKLKGERVLILTAELDTRSAERTVQSHNGKTREATPIRSLEAHLDHCWGFDCVAIDEVQLITGIVDGVRALLRGGKTVVLSGIDGHFNNDRKWELMDPWVKLIPLANETIKLEGACFKCSNYSLFTVRRPDGPRHGVAGGTERWLSLCRPCFDDYEEAEGTVINEDFIIPTKDEEDMWRAQRAAKPAKPNQPPADSKEFSRPSTSLFARSRRITTPRERIRVVFNATGWSTSDEEPPSPHPAPSTSSGHGAFIRSDPRPK